MRKLFLLSMFALTCFSCEEQGKGLNADSKTMSQTETEVDRALTQKARQAITGDSSLSVHAKNIKITTANGVVTLRGSVASSQEKESIARKINDLAGVKRVDNQLEVTSK